jgi:MFS family permease
MMTDVDAPRVPSATRAWWLIAVLFITAIVSYSNRLVLGVLVDPLRTTFGVSDSAISLLQGPAFTVIYVLASLPLGRLADRINRKRLITAGATTWAIGATLCAWAPNFNLLLAARILVGVSEATLIPTAVSMIADSFQSHRRGTAFGVFAMATVVGGPLGISAGGILLDQANSGLFSSWPLIGALPPWRTVLVMFGLVGLIAPLLLLTVKEPARIVATDSAPGSVRDFIKENGRSLLPLYLGCGLLAIGDYGLVSWAPSVLIRRFEWRPDAVGVAFGFITALAGILGAFSGGTLSDLAERRMGLAGRFRVSFGAALLGGCAAVAISGGSANWVLTGVGAWVLVSTVGGIGGLVGIQSAVPNQFRGTAASVLTFCNTLFGYGGGPTLVALVTEHGFASPQAVGYGISVVVAPAALLAGILFYGSSRAALKSPPRVLV